MQEKEYDKQLEDRSRLALKNVKKFNKLEQLFEKGEIGDAQVARQTQILLDDEAQLDTEEDYDSECSE